MEMELAVADRSTDQSVSVLDSATADSRRPCRSLVPATERRSTNALRMRYQPSSSLREIKNVSRGREGRIGVFPGVVLRLILGGLAGQNEVVLHPRNRGSFSSKTRRENGVGQNGC
jgi:hypothetical protein